MRDTGLWQIASYASYARTGGIRSHPSIAEEHLCYLGPTVILFIQELLMRKTDFPTRS